LIEVILLVLLKTFIFKGKNDAIVCV